MAEALIELKDVVKKFKNRLVLNGINMKIEDKDIFGIIGVSGSGKTTILNLVIGFLRTNSGTIVYNNKKISSMQGIVNQTFGFASQAGSYYQKLTVEENLEFFGRMYNMNYADIKDRITEILNLIDLIDSRNKLASQLSTGMQRRLDIACALMHSPRVLILDEPTEDLDPILRKELLALIRKINDEQGTTIIMTSHLLGEIELICNKIAILNNGRIIQQGSPDSLKDEYSKNYELSLQTKNQDYEWIKKHLAMHGHNKIFDKKHRIIVYSEKPESTMRTMLALIKEKDEKIVELSLNKPSLEEVFEALTRKH
ncbi:ABC transporter ATP-binding protein [Candidatus Woesearchaeota archaeon]|nr:ABC transporter ATP-binding protein [Candidatus Woesearchaeota archaeon]